MRERRARRMRQRLRSQTLAAGAPRIALPTSGHSAGRQDVERQRSQVMRDMKPRKLESSRAKMSETKRKARAKMTRRSNRARVARPRQQAPKTRPESFAIPCWVEQEKVEEQEQALLATPPAGNSTHARSRQAPSAGESARFSGEDERGRRRRRLA